MHKTFILFLLGSIGYSQSNNQENLSNIFLNNGVEQQSNSGFSFTKNYNPSGSNWAINTDESLVYKALFKYSNPTNPNLSYELRIGKGGQIYSFKTSSGETIPPQWRDPDGAYGSESAPWVDEVWQLVAVDGSQNDPANNNRYFIHQAGVYLKDPENLSTPFYSPQVAEYYNNDKQEYTTVNWGQHAHIGDNLTAGFTSSILYYTKYKNIGNGIIQVDYSMYNFGSDKINHINMPWGGVRYSTYGNFFVSNTDNTFYERKASFSDPAIKTTSTNGWVAFSNNEEGNLPSLGLLSDNSSGLIRLGVSGRLSDRDYTVYSGIRSQIDLSFGKQLHIRNYFILDNSVSDIQSRIATLNLASKTFYGFESRTKSSIPSTKYFFEKTDSSLNAVDTDNNNGLSLQLQPYNNSYPLFIIEGLNNEFRITSDLYTYSNLPYDGKTKRIKLIGFSDSKKSISIIKETICYGSNYTFPDGSIKKNITSNTVHISDMGVNAINGYHDLIQTDLMVDMDNTIKMIPRSIVGINAPTSNIELDIENGGTVKLQPQVSENGITSIGTGTWSWEGPNGFSAQNRVITIDDFNLSKTGMYHVNYLKTNNCIASSTFVLSLEKTLNITELNSLKTSYTLYPNPSSNQATITLFNADIETFEIYNMLGQDLSKYISKNQPAPNQMTLFLNAVPMGNYFVKINNSIYVRVVKK